MTAKAIPMLPVMSEAALDDLIREACKVRGLLAYHTRDSRRSAAGFPDWTIAGLGGVIFRECKGYDARGRLGKWTPAQVLWNAVLKASGADAGGWVPEDWMSGCIDRELEALKDRK